MPRIFYSKQSPVKEHLTRLHLEDFKDKIIIKLILNKELNAEKIIKTDKNFLSFQTKVGKSYKSHGWVIPRNKLEFLIPKTSYEQDCDLIIDDIPTKGRLNLVFRIFYKRNLAMDKHLKELHAKNPSKMIDIVLLLNHNFNNQNENLILKQNEDNINKKISNLIKLNDNLKIEVSSLIEEKNKLSNQIKNQDQEIKTLKILMKKLKCIMIL